jgi:hypothetical protein
MPQPPAVVLAFDPHTRQSDRRRKADARLRREQRRADRKQLKAEAETLGMTTEAFEANADLHAHYEAVRELEAAYGHAPAEGRRALLGIISRYFADGLEAGIEDTQAEISRQIMAAAHRKG